MRLERAAATTNRALATVLDPVTVDEDAAAVAKESAATGETVPEIVRRRRLVPGSTIRKLFSPSNPAGAATHGGG